MSFDKIETLCPDFNDWMSLNNNYCYKWERFNYYDSSILSQELICKSPISLEFFSCPLPEVKQEPWQVSNKSDDLSVIPCSMTLAEGFNLPVEIKQHSLLANQKPSFSSSHVTVATSSNSKICNFCRRNGDRKYFYTTHRLKDAMGNVECPILQKHVCEVCGATGKKAHTRTYCPVLRATCTAPPKNSVFLKTTEHDSCGRRRKNFRH